MRGEAGERQDLQQDMELMQKQLDRATAHILRKPGAPNNLEALSWKSQPLSHSSFDSYPPTKLSTLNAKL
jgi:hypothetical protein